MPNRAERRAQARQSRKGGSPDQQVRGRGAVNEYTLQERSRRLSESGEAEWKPSGGSIVDLSDVSSASKKPKSVSAPHSIRQWLRVVTWTLIVLSGIAFLIVMWLPKSPMWLIMTVSIVFVIGVLSLFFTAGDPKDNPNLDANGTAV
ncbi:membrane protein [Bifidobacterium bombi]|uniref:Tripartite tricarboxylate transporter TctB family protein n=1 Tax=Bifidobacterium bombi DSM 19703 TaxID=1341695 RepID=A0A080N5R3_9BIFI|nr:membrane protein [Bifidobacterium bombi]KFF30919.1 hypothetical protein BBOMB_0240 [Bifidobacterium bombi DSM 19703]